MKTKKQILEDVIWERASTRFAENEALFKAIKILHSRGYPETAFELRCIADTLFSRERKYIYKEG